jgi:hypothetical protein
MRKRRETDTDFEKNSKIEGLPSILEAAGWIVMGYEGEAVAEAAKITGTNRQYVADVKKLKEDSPETFEAVKSGGMRENPTQRIGEGFSYGRNCPPSPKTYLGWRIISSKGGPKSGAASRRRQRLQVCPLAGRFLGIGPFFQRGWDEVADDLDGSLPRRH